MGKFKIPETPPTTNKTIRFPNDVVEEVEKALDVEALVNEAVANIERVKVKLGE